LVLAERKPRQLPEVVPPPVQAAKVRKTKKALPRLQLIAFVAVGFVTLLALTSMYVMMAMIGYQITDLKGQIATRQTENKKIELEINRLKSLDRIETIATTKLGMTKPEKFAYLVIDQSETEKRNAVARKPSGSNVASSDRHPFIQAVTDFLTARSEGRSQVGAKS
jgi:cell division protein FtsL